MTLSFEVTKESVQQFSTLLHKVYKANVVDKKVIV